ncbi:hypothetical protein [Sinanaerobacter chloroacetimidivorans]|uniref:Uncharacterized protein n=1 Tax=Sinanaerobacter chloroacetimidivorans TaxID=2818044 RepID=A0A8J8B0T1_9FIRM|nr:hypothetical protein [Sinanaerobacter chloroacetimidivorans]MBR0596951.1 hypothetical protein [Sinanaerobacter chloroacetimidivorans]
MNTKQAFSIMVASLLCGIINEDFNNCDYCPIRVSCDKCSYETYQSNPLSEYKVHKAITTLWDETVYETLLPLLVIAKSYHSNR